VIGLPAIGLPTHIDQRGVPFGIQVIGGPYSEDVLLRMGMLVEDHYRWHERPLPENLH
jgi:amidase